MSYWQFRRKLYHHFLRQWLNSLKQISWAVVALFPLAIPALIFAPLLILAMLTDPTLSGQKYHMALWSYLLLTYTWVFFQKKFVFLPRLLRKNLDKMGETRNFTTELVKTFCCLLVVPSFE